MSGILDARPKIGYFYSGVDKASLAGERIRNKTVGELMSVPALANEQMSIADGIVQLFMADAGSLFVINTDRKLVGVVSRKDFLKFAISEGNLHELPINMVMTRMPNLITLTEDDSLIHAAHQIINHEVDSLPVLRGEEVVGRISKTTITAFFLEITED